MAVTAVEHVTSADGTRIAYDRGGEGPSLVLVHGTASDHRSWSAVLPDLRERFTVYAMDRRGRGESGDRAERNSAGQPEAAASGDVPEGRSGDRQDANASGGGDDYAIEREFEDVVAVCAAAEGPVNLLGHSYGAVCSIGAAPHLGDLDRLVLYEPPLWTAERETVPDEVLARMEAHAERGENEAVLETFFQEVTGDAGRLEVLRTQSDYGMRVAAADKLPREIRGRLTFRPDVEEYADVTAPTRFLLGTETSEPLVRSTEAARELFPESDLVALEGQGHAAMNTAPELFVSRVVEFLREEP